MSVYVVTNPRVKIDGLKNILEELRLKHKQVFEIYPLRRENVDTELSPMLICYDSEGNQLLHIIDIFNHLDQEKINSEYFEGLLMKIGLIPNILKIDLTDFGLGDFIFVKDQEDIRVIIQKEMEERGQEERIEKSIGNKETKQQIVGLSMNINEELFECFESLLYEVDENGNPIQNSVPKIPNKNQLLTKNLQFYKEFYELEEL